MWVSPKDKLPPDNELVLVYDPSIPNHVQDDYSMWKDGHDRTDEELTHRKYARLWFSKHPHRTAYLYETALCGKKWMVRFTDDSRYNYIADLHDVKGWIPLTSPSEPIK